MDPTAVQVARRALTEAKQLKARIVQQDGIGTDIVPRVELFREGVPLGVIWLNDSSAEEANWRRRMFTRLTLTIGASAADRAHFLTEQYEHRSQTGRSYDNYEHGSAARLFAAGDKATKEGVMVAVAGADGAFAAAYTTYTYDVGRRVRWDPPMVSEPKTGAMPDAMSLGFATQAARDAPLDVLHLGIALSCTVAAPQMIAPPRNAPCPCESGRKAKHCCWA